MHSASQMLWAFLDTSRHFKYIYLTHNIIINVYIAPGNGALDKPDTLLPGDHRTTTTLWRVHTSSELVTGCFVAKGCSSQFMWVFLSLLSPFVDLTSTWSVLFHSNATNYHHKDSFTLLLFNLWHHAKLYNTIWITCFVMYMVPNPMPKLFTSYLLCYLVCCVFSAILCSSWLLPNTPQLSLEERMREKSGTCEVGHSEGRFELLWVSV